MYANRGSVASVKIITPNIIQVDLIGKCFIRPLSVFHTKNKDAPVDREHPLLHILLRAMYLLHIRRYDARHVDYRAKPVCNGA